MCLCLYVGVCVCFDLIVLNGCFDQRWESPIVDDPVTREELEQAERNREKEENAKFEASNPDFCNEFISDQVPCNVWWR